MLPESKFYILRTLFALSHVDGVLSNEELSFMDKILADFDLSDKQRILLEDDVRHEKLIKDMFGGIVDLDDQKEFFALAYDLVHVDGAYCGAEYDAMRILQEMYDSNVGKSPDAVSLELVCSQSKPDDDYTECMKSLIKALKANQTVD